MLLARLKREMLVLVDGLTACLQVFWLPLAVLLWRHLFMGLHGQSLALGMNSTGLFFDGLLL